MRTTVYPVFSLVLAIFGAGIPCSGQRLLASMRQEGAAQLKILVLEGAEGPVGTAGNPAPGLRVRVEDADGRPVQGAAVTFLLPQSGAGAVFSDGSKIQTVPTDANGEVAAPGMRYGNSPGAFEIRVTAGWQGAKGSLAVNRSVAGETSRPQAVAKKSGSGKMIAILAAVGGGAAAALAMAGGGGKGGGSSPPTTPSTPPTPTGVVITIGTGTITAP